ncbi:MAG: UpxY family transcription antiterminator [Gemmatimonadales bacterium]|nr:MAG: UpxY family transcription antiterminator [Gemmatimonadales bacterium]
MSPAAVNVPPASSHAPWRALHTRSRSERVVAGRLTQGGFETFSAQARMKRQWSDRVKRVPVPLFPGYVFARVSEIQLPRALGVAGVAGVVRSGGAAAVVREDEIEAVRHLVRGIEETGELPESVDPLSPGDRVVITTGPFRGMMGALLEMRGEAHVAIRIEALRQATAVRLDRGMVAPVARSG